MNKLVTCAFILTTLTSCASRHAIEDRLSVAETFISAFYAYDRAALESFLSVAETSMPTIVYYQGWAEGGNYEIVDRKPCEEGVLDQVTCSITVRDDPMLALGIDFNVTDTFHISFSNGDITAVKTTSNDLQIYHDAADWVRKEMPELISEPCRGFFDGGPTPGDCARAMTIGYGRFAASEDFPTANYN